MKWKTILLIAGVAASNASFANENNDIAQRRDFLSRSSNMLNEYSLIRNDLDRDGGLRFRYDEVNSRLSVWTKSWEAIINYVKNPPASSMNEVEREVGEKLNRIEDTFNLIEIDATKLVEDLSERELRLRSLGKIDYRIDHYDLGDEGQTTQETRVTELADSIRNQIVNLQTLISDFKMCIQFLREAMASKIAVVWAQRGIVALSDSERKVNEFFVALDLLRETEGGMLKKLGLYQRSAARFQTFAALKNLESFIAACGTYEADVNRLPISETFRTKSAERIKKLCNTYGAVYRALNANPAKSAASAYAKRSERIRNVCSSEASAIMNCKLFSTIAGLKESTILALKRETLVQLEAILNSIEDNKRRGLIFGGDIQ